jgi:hypothetical protein
MSADLDLLRRQIEKSRKAPATGLYVVPSSD